MLTFPKDRYKGFGKKLRELRAKCEEETDYTGGFDSILEELYAKPDLVEEIMTHNHTVEEFYDVLKIMAPRYMKLVNQFYHLDGTKRTKREDPAANKWKSDSRYWTDPLATPLPNVTNFKIYCSELIHNAESVAHRFSVHVRLFLVYGYVKEPMTEWYVLTMAYSSATLMIALFLLAAIPMDSTRTRTSAPALFCSSTRRTRTRRPM